MGVDTVYQPGVLEARQPEVWWWPVRYSQAGRLLARDRPQVVTLCGSTRFVEAFNEWRRTFTYKGVIVLSIEIVTTQAYEEDPQHVDRANKEMLDALHKRKIDLSDAIFVLNVGGYIGESTRSEIAYAEEKEVPVHYLEDPK